MNDRLQIAAIMMAKMYNELTDVLEPSHLADEALDYADALIAAAGEDGMSEKPTSHSDPIKSDWSLRSCFEQLSKEQNWLNDKIMLEKGQQDEICDLVEKHYRYPKPSVPSVEEIYEQAIKCRNVGRFAATQVANGLHQWLTERGAK